MELPINYVAILVAVVANFFLGFLWYTVLFGKIWAVEMGFDITVKPSGGQMAKGMIVMVIGNFLMAYVFAHNHIAWSYVPEMDKSSSVEIIMSSAIFTWLGFYLPVDLNTITWERKSGKLFAINTVYHLLTLLVASTILTLM